ncbi:MAG: DUF4129 domain-containing protein, partial [Gammaproteobacteria bacterium]|nr:DUF4129 domain-containing protein [Gammaproteobacteria bacterium]
DASQRRLLERFGFEGEHARTLVILLAIGLAASLLILALVLARGLLPKRRDPVVLAWQRLCAHLARQGLPAQPGETPRAFAERVAAARPELAEDTRALAAQYQQLRYEPDPAPGLREAFISAARRFRPRRWSRAAR